MGRPFMPHQQLVVDVMLEVQAEAAGDPSPGEWAFDDGTLTAQRRIGKTSIVTPVTAHRAKLIERARIFMTAQTRDKARKRWMDVTDDVLGSVLRDDVRRKISQGFEELRWKDGGAVFEPFAPNEDGLHSETPDLVFVDEFWAFDAEQARMIKAGYVPAFATSSGQALKMSTAGTAKSAWLNDARRKGRAAVEAGVRLGTAYFEWGLPDLIDGIAIADLDDEQLVQACIDYHPAVCHLPDCRGAAARKPCPHGFTVRPAAIRSAWTEMADRAEFIRAYGNRTQDDTASRWTTIESGLWLRQTSKIAIPTTAPVALGFDVDPDLGDAAVTAGHRLPNGNMLTELLRRQLGTRWLAPYVLGVVERQKPRAVAVNDAGPAREVADEIETALKEAGVELLRLSARDYAAACVRHLEQMRGRTWFHRGEPDLTSAAAVVEWRKVGAAGRAWGRPADEPISALSSNTLAGWAYDHAPEPEKPLPKFWMG